MEGAPGAALLRIPSRLPSSFRWPTAAACRRWRSELPDRRGSAIKLALSAFCSSAFGPLCGVGAHWMLPSPDPPGPTHIDWTKSCVSRISSAVARRAAPGAHYNPHITKAQPAHGQHPSRRNGGETLEIKNLGPRRAAAVLWRCRGVAGVEVPANCGRSGVKVEQPVVG